MLAHFLDGQPRDLRSNQVLRRAKRRTPCSYCRRARRPAPCSTLPTTSIVPANGIGSCALRRDGPSRRAWSLLRPAIVRRPGSSKMPCMTCLTRPRVRSQHQPASVSPNPSSPHSSIHRPTEALSTSWAGQRTTPDKVLPPSRSSLLMPPHMRQWEWPWERGINWAL